jgi:1,4-dihydroxy-2-naphthoate octaprenyltransferase
VSDTFGRTRWAVAGSAEPVDGTFAILARMPSRKLLATVALVVGIVLIAIAVVYWVEPAKSLPGFFPGHQAGSSHHHVKHGIAAFLVGLACLVFAWFNTGGERARRMPA